MKKIILSLAMLAILGLSANAQLPDTISFDKPTTAIVIDTANGNLWQIGKPQKTFFNSAYTGTKAILTDTILDYPPNDTSTFIYIIQDTSFYYAVCETCMEFYHKYDMDSLGDKGIIDVSYDKGNSWLTLKDTVSFSPWFHSFQWYSDYHESTGIGTTHPLITSGKSDGWILSTFCWQWGMGVKKDTIILFPDTLMIRFTFISDSIIKNKEGWMIDEIITSYSFCSGINEINIDDNINIYPNPATDNLTIETGDLRSTNYDLRIEDVMGNIILEKSLYNKETNIDVSAFAKGMYFVKIKTERGVESRKFVKL